MSTRQISFDRTNFRSVSVLFLAGSGTVVARRSPTQKKRAEIWRIDESRKVRKPVSERLLKMLLIAHFLVLFLKATTELLVNLLFAVNQP